MFRLASSRFLASSSASSSTRLLVSSRRNFSYSRPVWQNVSPSAAPSQVEILAKLKSELKNAMKSKNTAASTVIRSILAEATNLEKTKAHAKGLDEAAVYGVIRKGVAKRTDAAAQFTSASRADLASKEESEITLLNSFLPPPLTADEINKYLADAVSSVLVASPAAQPGMEAQGKRAHGNVNALMGKALKAFNTSIPPAYAGSIGNEELMGRLKGLVEERLK
ncbi:GatB/YqeY domain-containing protein [Clavulina sp. PMI_390]|nr:GatB/YqeY domain-containing protein [Clavulina sp. PMI_390]